MLFETRGEGEMTHSLTSIVTLTYRKYFVDPAYEKAKKFTNLYFRSLGKLLNLFSGLYVVKIDVHGV